jgi:hypothetical protein
MYGIYANIGGILMVNVTIYTIHGSYGIYCHLASHHQKPSRASLIPLATRQAKVRTFKSPDSKKTWASWRDVGRSARSCDLQKHGVETETSNMDIAPPKGLFFQGTTKPYQASF